MLEFKANATIEAPPDVVWAVLVDIERWPEWDRFCERIEGTLGLGQRVKAFSKLSPGRGFKVKVTELEPPSRMTWSGGMPLGLFKGVRTFSLRPNGGGTDFELREVFSGPMLGLIRKSLPDMSEAFASFAEGLKIRAEARSASS